MLAGDVSPPGRTNTLKLVNLYRYLAYLPPAVLNTTWDAQAQQCALMLDANQQLSHAPPTTWRCYSPEGAAAAGQSNIAGGLAAVAAVDAYVGDAGNPTTLGHRRWILSGWVSEMGIGSTTSYSCLKVIF